MYFFCKVKFNRLFSCQKHNEDKNAEAELEKMGEKEKFEKKIGLLKYLVDDELDLKGSFKKEIIFIKTLNLML